MEELEEEQRRDAQWQMSAGDDLMWARGVPLDDRMGTASSGGGQNMLIALNTTVGNVVGNQGVVWGHGENWTRGGESGQGSPEMDQGSACTGEGSSR